MAISGWGIFIILLVVIVLGGAGYILGYAHYRARRLGLPPPSLNPFARNRREANPTYRAPAPAPGGIQGWISDKINGFRNKRTAGGAYESTGYGGGVRGSGRGRQGFGPLDPDGAWDARVDNEADAYYEEQELGLQDPGQGPYGGSGYGNNIGVGGIEEGRGRSRSRQRELDDRYDEEVHGGSHGSGGLNPFGDQNAAPSLRSVSPRPEIDTKSHKKNQSSLTSGDPDNSPTERRSMFREEV